jgi:hypothetical protein
MYGMKSFKVYGIFPSMPSNLQKPARRKFCVDMRQFVQNLYFGSKTLFRMWYAQLVGLRRAAHESFGLIRTQTASGAVRLAVHKCASYAPPHVSCEVVNPDTL